MSSRALRAEDGVWGMSADMAADCLTFGAEVGGAIMVSLTKVPDRGGVMSPAWNTPLSFMSHFIVPSSGRSRRWDSVGHSHTALCSSDK